MPYQVLILHVGCSQNDGHLLVIDDIAAPNEGTKIGPQFWKLP